MLSTCKARAIVEMIDDDYEVTKIPKLSDHSHVCDEASCVKWLIMEEMEKEFIKDLLQIPSTIRKKIILQYKQKYCTKKNVWEQVQSLLPEDHTQH